MRHSNAARQLDVGTKARVLSDLLGHRDSESVSAYVRIATQSLREVSLRCRDEHKGHRRNPGPRCNAVPGFKRAMGMGYRRAEFVLNSFVRFIRDRYGERPAALDQAVTQWATRIEAAKPSRWVTSSAWCASCAYSVAQRPAGLRPRSRGGTGQESVFVPYIFSREEVLALLDAATRHEVCSMYGSMLRALTLVLYCTGMRLGEATKLRASTSICAEPY